MQEFFAVADYIAFNDPAVRSYLLGEQVSSKGRETAVNEQDFGPLLICSGTIQVPYWDPQVRPVNQAFDFAHPI